MRNSPSYGSSGGHSRHFDTILSPLVKTGAGASNRSYAFFSFFLFLLLGVFLTTRLLLDPSVCTFLLHSLCTVVLFLSNSSKRHSILSFWPVLFLMELFCHMEFDIGGARFLVSPLLSVNFSKKETITFRQTKLRTVRYVSTWDLNHVISFLVNNCPPLFTKTTQLLTFFS